MLLSAGSVIDPYDDGFRSLKNFFGSGREMPDFIKTASILDQDQLSKLPDHAFAVVMVGPDRMLRKYACVDKAHTAVNVMYFLKSEADLPPSARVKVAENLIRACRHFSVQPPAQLSKIASLNKKRLIKTDGPDIMVPVQGREKESDVPVNRNAYPTETGRTKLAYVMTSPYVDLDEPYRPERNIEKTASSSVSALPDGRFPLDTFSQVKEAVEFFRETARTIHPRVRREMCVKIASRAEDLGVQIPDVIRKYGSTEWAAKGEREATLVSRRQVWASSGNEEGPGMLDLLMEKQASTDPDVFANVLAEIDAQTGIDHLWDRHLADPWLSTFGIRKTAAWKWSDNGTEVTEQQLKRLVGSRMEKVAETFGSHLADGLARETTVVFDSLPLDTKRILARMAQE